MESGRLNDGGGTHMFKVLRYYSVIAALLFVLGAVVLALVHRSIEIDEYVEQTEVENLQMATSMAKTAWPLFQAFVAQASSLPLEELRQSPKIEEMDRLFRTMVGELPVLKIEVFDADGLIVYSPDSARIGRRKLPGSVALQASEARAPITVRHFRERFVGFRGEVKNRHLVSTYYPILSPDGTPEGVFELYTDVSFRAEHLSDDVFELSRIVAGVFVTLFAVLFLLMRRAQAILRLQHEELEERRTRLRDGEDRLRVIADHASDWEAWLDPEGRPLWINPEAEKLLGHSVDSCMAMPDYPLPLVHEADRVHVEEHLERAAAGGEDGDVEFRIVCGNGTVKWIQAAYRPARREDGSFLGSRWSAHEVTARKRAVQMLRESEQRFRSVAETAADAIISINSEGRIIAWNPAAGRIFGHGEEEVLGKDVTLLMPERYRDAHKTGLARHMDGPGRLEVQAAEFSGLHADGHEFPLELSLARWEMDGQPFFTAILRDATERKRVEENLRFTQFSMESAGDAIFWMNPDGRIFFVNDSACRYLGFSRDELTRMTVRDINPTYTRESWEEFWKTLKVRKTMRFETTHQDKDGILHPVEITANYLMYEGREYDFAFVRDVSERKAAEEKIERSNQELQQFAYVASHDLQEPLRMVTSYLELLKRRFGDQLDGMAVEFLDYAVDGSRRMQTLIRDLLEYSRIETKGAGFEEIDLEKILALTLDNLAATIAESGATITHDTLPTLRADGGQMTRLFQNVLGNAIKYRKPDVAPSIRLTVEKDGGTWVIGIADNGIGIEDKHFDCIFGVFQRLHGRDEYEGTGIGLAICKKIVERHEGWIDVQSEAGVGTTFFIHLPADGE